LTYYCNREKWLFFFSTERKPARSIDQQLLPLKSFYGNEKFCDFITEGTPISLEDFLENI